MTIINGLPAHVLLVHFLVVLAPLTAASEILCALWRAARQRLIWPTAVLAAATVVLTPLTTHAGQWLYDLRRSPGPLLREHAERGGTMIYFSVAILIVAVALMVLHVREHRANAPQPVLAVIVAVLAVVAGLSTMIQVYRIGDIGSQSVWGDEISQLTKSNTG
jgi:hypothetical protein